MSRRAAARLSLRWLHSLNSRPHFSRARLSAAPFTTSTRRASSFYAFIYAPFIIFKVRLFLAPAPSSVIYFLPPASRRPCVVVSLALFLFSCFLLWSTFFIYFLLYYYVLACSRYFIFVLRGERSTLFLFFINRDSHRIMVIKG